MTFKQRFKKWSKKNSYSCGQMVLGWMRLAYGWGKRDERGRVCVWTPDKDDSTVHTTACGRYTCISVYKHCPYCGGKIKEAK